MHPRISIVVPAHNEEHLIDRAIDSLLDGAAAGEFEIVVVANGCTDRTAERARAHPGVAVVELEQGSKIAALNAGDAVATTFPRAYVDADVIVTPAALRALATALTVSPEKAVVASPQMVVDAAASSWPTRQYYKVWALTDFRRTGHIGSGVYALSAAGRARFDDFPPVIADDRFVQQQFELHERVTVRETFTVAAPRTISALVRRGVRIAAGNLQLPAQLQRAAVAPLRDRVGNLLRRIGAKPGLWPAGFIYAAVTVIIRLRARRLVASGAVVAWNRDTTTRSE